jgi:hypothetical protein
VYTLDGPEQNRYSPSGPSINRMLIYVCAYAEFGIGGTLSRRYSKAMGRMSKLYRSS